MERLVVASTNPVKIETTRIGFGRMFPDVEFKVDGVSAKSDVPDQPMGEDQTLTGAENRAENVSRIAVDADYWIGVEGGLKETKEKLEAFAWVVVKSKDGKIGRGRTASFFLPEKMAELIRQGKELGEVDDIVFGRKNSKQTNGTVGNLTGDVRYVQLNIRH